MVALVQDNDRSVPEEIRYYKGQDQVDCYVSSNSREAEVPCKDITRSSKDVAVVIPSDSIASTSTQCSDVENDDEEEETDTDEGDWIPDLPVPAVLQQHQQVTTADGNLVLPNAETSNFGDVRVKNSTNVHLGNKTFYKGPVTIKQFVYANPVPILENGSEIEKDASHVSKPDTNDDSPSTLSKKVLNWLRSWRCAAFTCALALVLVIVVATFSVYITHSNTVPPEALIPQVPDTGLNGSIVKNVRFIKRNEWGAQPPSTELKKLTLPVPYVIISHTATEVCLTQADCTLHVRFAQTFHIESRKWSDIGYNFLVGGDGYAYVGRSWEYMGAHAFGFNDKSIGISFIGTFNTVIPNKSQLYAAQQVIKLGVELGKIAPDYKLLGHRQVSATLSPGDALYKVIQTWPHWSSSP